ncbi:MAG: DEAD/DEAH box helicase family protein, partial [Thermoguttaceae bacterium]|nr:DEAD/DEAH box helicase family protein [Thermoguttaceae bacterium]
MTKTIKLATTKPVVPKIYAYTTPEVARHDGWTKIGYTEGDVAKRLKQQLQTADIEYNLEWSLNAFYEDGSGETFRDTDFHAYLRKEGVEQEKGKNNEWFHITGPDSKQKCYEFKENRGVSSTPESRPYVLRKEQEEAVERAQAYFESTPKGEFLWNAKPRFGKTLAVYDLCLRMKAKSVLIVTNRPAVANSWLDDYVKFVGDVKGYRFVSETDALKNSAFVTPRQMFSKYFLNSSFFEFLSLQDLKGSLYFRADEGGSDKLGHIKEIKWDLLVIDEAHEGVDTVKTDVAFEQITRKHTLHLSGTPFKALANDKFPSDAIYNWTYADEQRAKRDWTSDEYNSNPYADLPQLRMFTYQASEMIRDVVERGIEIDGETEEYAFDLNEFFAVNEKGRFIHNDAVDRFLDALTTQEKYPFSTEELRGELRHTFWLLDRVES